MANKPRKHIRVSGIVAFVCAVFVTTILGTALFTIVPIFPNKTVIEPAFGLPSFGLLILTFGAGVFCVAALPMLIIVLVARRLKWPRPLTDVLGGVLASIPAYHLLVIYEPTNSTELLVEIGATAVWGALITYLYWRFAGRPRPPYETEEPAT